MKSPRNTSVVFRLTILVCILLCLETSSEQFDLEQAIERQLNKEQFQQTNLANQHASHLERKRRYLEFPEGSSFQLVYDLIVGVVDFTNYLILGVTVALAWELPSKPPSEIFNDLSERLKDGTLGTSRNDTADKIKYLNLKSEATTTNSPLVKYKINLKPIFRPPMHYQYYTPGIQNSVFQDSRLYAPQLYKNHNLLHTRKQPHPFVKWAENKKYPKFSVKGIPYPWWNLPERLKNSFAKRPSIRRFDKNIKFYRAPYKNELPTGTQSQFQGAGRAQHRIYPVFGKRSIISTEQTRSENLSSTHTRYNHSGIEQLSKLDRIHIGHHRKTRHDLYQRIETYLNGRGSHGHHCVLKALCETGQKSDELKTGSFVAELMRAIFTIPEPFDGTPSQNQHVNDKVLRYDAASALKQDCSRRYTHCQESLWSSHFVL